MIDKDKPVRHRQTPTAAVYRPPAARQAENRKSTDNSKSTDTKQTRVRRPDQQMYVPRPKRASYGNDQPRSESRSKSRLSLDSDQSSDNNKSFLMNSEELKIPKQNGKPKDCSEEVIPTLPSVLGAKNDDKPDISTGQDSELSQPPNKTSTIKNKCSEIINSNHLTTTEAENTKRCEKTDESSKYESDEMRLLDNNESSEIVSGNDSKNAVDQKESIMQVDSLDNDHSDNRTGTQNKVISNEKSTYSPSPTKEHINNGEGNDIMKKESTATEAMETISISSESRSDDCSRSSMSSSDSKTSVSSVDCNDKENRCKYKSSEKMDIDHFEGKHLQSQPKSNLHHKETKTRNIAEPSTTKISQVLVISDSSSSNDSMKSLDDENKKDSSVEKSQQQLPSRKGQDLKHKCSEKQSKVIDPNECDWESLYDDSGECLVPSLMEELTNSVGRVKVTSADSDYRPYQSIEERTNDGECVIEIYDFPAEFKTTDLFNVFAAYRNKNFQIKWVDDTHALGIFPSPLMADEVLACTLPFVKTRPLRLGIAESRNKARNLILPLLPSMERPKTCTALARRLVTGALGLRIPTSSQEREKEKQVLKEAREKRNEEKIKTLNRDIMSMKQIKVRLINQMKSEGEKYRQWRASREQEVCKLRQQNRQKETKFVKMESYYMKQQNVYKRKLEESAAVIRRLKDSLALQQRNAKDKKSLLGNAEKVNQWVNQEFSTMVNALEAERTLENLKEDRALLSKELSRLKESLTAPGLREEEKTKISEEIKTLNEDIELRSTQILDLTHKLQSLDSFQENKSKTRYECVQTMADAKTALRYVFDTAHNYLSELHKNKASKEAALMELRDNYEALQMQQTEIEVRLKEEIEKHKKTESNLNEKVLMLLKRLQDLEKGSRLINESRASLLDTTNTMEDESSGSAKDKLLIKQLKKRVEELEQLKEKEKEQKKPKREKKVSDWNAVITPETRRKFFEDEDDYDQDDSTTDPDWKQTPVYHRIKSLRENIKTVRENSKEKLAVKRNIDGQPCCSCKKDCKSKVCSCNKNKSFCTGNCLCADSLCKNKEQYSMSRPSTSSPNDESTGDDSDISFKKPR